MIFKNNVLNIGFLALIVITICILSIPKEDFLITNSNVKNKPRIILDAGHGGFDGGAVAQDGTVEKDINLNIALSLEKMLKSSGFDVIMTRRTDTSTEDDSGDRIPSKKKSDLKNRLLLMEKYNDSIFVSIHLNKFTTSAARGSQIFYSANCEDSKILGDFIQNSIVNKIQKDNKRVNKKSTSSTYILHNATVPAVLVECGFLSNKSELMLLKKAEYQNEMAFCIYCGILDYYKEN